MSVGVAKLSQEEDDRLVKLIEDAHLNIIKNNGYVTKAPYFTPVILCRRAVGWPVCIYCV